MSTTIEFNPMRFNAEELEQIAVSDIDERLTRTNYFNGRLLTATDLNRDQTYLDERLLELGRAYGDGIIHGLQVELRFGVLQVQAGRAITPSGRVLELSLDEDQTHDIDLNSSAEISTLNDGQYRHIDRGLYALVLRYAEAQQKLAEVFPTDLGKQRDSQADTYAEGVDLALIKLPIGLEQDEAFTIRDNLMWSLAHNSPISAGLPADSIALGVLAMSYDQALWFDSELLRHPVRSEVNNTDLNTDLERRHHALFQDIVQSRDQNGYPPRFSALEYFHTLPPVGPLPKASADPSLGLQGYFPEHFEVHIAPVNRADIAAIRAESMPLSPLKLHDKALQEVMILAPLDDADYAEFAQRLEVESLSDDDNIDIPIIKPANLTLQGGLRAANADANWQALWDRVNEQELFYVRRPGRAAETGVSAVVLARGSVIPAPSLPDTPTTPNIPTIPDGPTIPTIPTTPTFPPFFQPYPGPYLTPGALQPISTIGGGPTSISAPTTTAPTPPVRSEAELVLRHINIERLAKHRPAQGAREQRALDQIQEKLANDMEATLIFNDILLHIEHRYDSVLWRTLARLESPDATQKLLQLLLEGHNAGVSSPLIILEATDSDLFRLTPALLEAWKIFAEEGQR